MSNDLLERVRKHAAFLPRVHYSQPLFRDIIAALSGSEWHLIDGTEPHACHVLAARYDPDCGEWVAAVVLSPPIYPFTHWRHLPAFPSSQGEPT